MQIKVAAVVRLINAMRLRSKSYIDRFGGKNKENATLISKKKLKN